MLSLSVHAVLPSSFSSLAEASLCGVRAILRVRGGSCKAFGDLGFGIPTSLCHILLVKASPSPDSGGGEEWHNRVTMSSNLPHHYLTLLFCFSV
jgi:hypothetical protein